MYFYVTAVRKYLNMSSNTAFNALYLCVICHFEQTSKYLLTFKAGIHNKDKVLH